jgi:hypothetical protein
MNAQFSDDRVTGHAHVGAATPQTPGRSARDESVPSLLRRLADDVMTLFAQEVALLKSETTSAIGDMKAGLVSLATGGAVTFMGALFLLLAAVYGLAEVMEIWLAALIVGGGVTLIGLAMLAAGRKKLEPASLRPRRTESSLRKDREMIKGAAHHGQA